MIIPEGTNDIAAAIEAGSLIGKSAVSVIKENLTDIIPPTVIRHKDYIAEFHPEFMLKPDRPTGTLVTHNLESFCRQFAKYKTPDSVILVDSDPEGKRGANFTGILNYHSVTQAEHGDFRVAYTAKLSVEWLRWMQWNKQAQAHNQFCEFLEDSKDIIITPDGTALFELISSLEGKVDAKFENAKNLHNGSMKLSYSEQVSIKGSGTTASQPGALEVPTQIVSSLAVFEFDAKYAVTSKLRYRIDKGQLVFAYEVKDPHLIVNDAVAHQVSKVEELTGVKPLMGVPPTK